jgi:hypothetical protein
MRASFSGTALLSEDQTFYGSYCTGLLQQYGSCLSTFRVTFINKTIFIHILHSYFLHPIIVKKPKNGVFSCYGMRFWYYGIGDGDGMNEIYLIFHADVLNFNKLFF